MTSVLAPPHTDIKPLLTVGPSEPTMPPMQEPIPPCRVKLEDDADRGRVRCRSDDNADELDLDGGGDGDVDGHLATSSNSEGPARKRRRSRKCLDKKYVCLEKGCGKSYSRAEHLYRHQLNHNPKEVFKCDIGDCQRTFVRLDLCNRHKDRHWAKDSALNRKDSTTSHVSPTGDSQPSHAPVGSMSPEANRSETSYGKGRPVAMSYSPKEAGGSPFTSLVSSSAMAYPTSMHTNGVEYMQPEPTYPRTMPQDPNAVLLSPSVQNNGVLYDVLSPVAAQHGFHDQPGTSSQSTGVAAYVAPQSFPSFALPPSEYSVAAVREPRPNFTTAAANGYADQGRQHGAGEMLALDQLAMPATIPVFGTDSILSKSPYVGMPEDFMAYLFNTHQGEGSPMAGMSMPGYNYGEFPQNQYNMPYYGAECNAGYFPNGAVMSVTNLVDQNLRESVISEEKSAELYEFIKERFHENGHSLLERQRDSILDGDRGHDSHMLSRQMMQAYIGSYWLHFSDQVPILHKASFSPDKTPNLLLIAMMTIGAACLDRTHGHSVTRTGAKLSNFLAWHLRWEMFQDASCRPPAKLWVFQTLLLLELYEKMYATRELHERAHIHHATTITLMRRGRALMGKSALDSPPNLRDEKTSSGQVSAVSSSSPDEWWNQWITVEATRRAAFVAFIIDSIHATMFGHSTVMVAHEMRLPLPCDDKLWKGRSGVEVARIEANMLAVGSKPISFLEGIKRTMSGDAVETNSFGRTVLMAGLLSVNWHMYQRDLQLSSLGKRVVDALGGRDRWRGTVMRAFDSWKTDFDTSLKQKENMSTDPYRYDPSDREEANVVFESRIVLHHLAHMAMHADIVDCQVLARAKRLLGRAIGAQDLTRAQRRMKDWAPSAGARDAAFYALHFLESVLVPKKKGGDAGPNAPPDEPYSARDDVLLNRSWVLYFATLVVWCYGFALEGPCPDLLPPLSQDERVYQMRQYLRKYGSIERPDMLADLKGFNRTTPLLMVLKETFELSRWQLLNEAANLLQNCIQLNAGAAVI